MTSTTRTETGSTLAIVYSLPRASVASLRECSWLLESPQDEMTQAVFKEGRPVKGAVVFQVYIGLPPLLEPGKGPTSRLHPFHLKKMNRKLMGLEVAERSLKPAPRHPVCNCENVRNFRC